MLINFRAYIKNKFKNDFLASMVVFLVAIPLCLGIAIASGAPPAAGLISGLIGGIIVGTLGGCSLQVSGPAAGLVAIYAEVVLEHGVGKIGLIILLAGVLQVVVGLSKIAQWFRAVSPAVIQGMLSGIGLLIFSSQFHVMVDDLPKTNGLLNLISIPKAIYKGVVPMDGLVHHLAALIGVITIIVIVLWTFFPQNIKLIPSPIVGVLLAIIISRVFQFPIKYVDIPSNLFEAVRFPDLESFSFLLNYKVWIAVVSIAFIASAETLLTATGIDKMHNGERTNYNREIIAQGIGNSLAGFLGALPITGVIVRSATNVQAGAKTRMSAVLHGVWLLIFVLLFPNILRLIPIASLAAILVYTGYKLMNFKVAKELLKYGKFEVVIYAVTIVAIVSTNLLEGIVIGFISSLLKLLYTFSHLEIKINKESSNNEIDNTYVHISGSVNFLNLPKFAEALEKIPLGLNVFICFDELNYIDHACLEILMNWEKQYQSSGGIVSIKWGELETRFLKNSKNNEQVFAKMKK